jgi:hypothetical protein
LMTRRSLRLLSVGERDGESAAGRLVGGDLVVAQPSRSP